MIRQKFLNNNFPNSIHPKEEFILNSDLSNFFLKDLNQNLIKKGTLKEVSSFIGKNSYFIYNEENSVLYKWNSLYEVWLQEYR